MLRIILAIAVASLLLAGCSATRSFEARFEAIEDGRLVVNCSDEVNRGKRNVDAVGYPCYVQLTEETRLTDENGGEFAARDLKSPALLRIVMTKPRKIDEKPSSRTTDLVAKEIVLLER